MTQIKRVVASRDNTEPEAISTDVRAGQLFAEHYDTIAVRGDRMFAVLFVLEWLAAIGAALWLSPLTWEGRNWSLHTHVYAALFLGGAITSLPLLLVLTRPGRPSTRYVIAVAQMLWSALFIHLTGGRIETHFHVFGSLAFLAFYRDNWTLVLATITVAADHFVRGMFWPESVYGVANPEWWRFLEHVGWVAFTDVFCALNVWYSRRDMWGRAEQQAQVEHFQSERLARVERLAEIGQLAASIGHELRNPLSAIQQAHIYIDRRISATPPVVDAKVKQFMGLVDRELNACARIIANLLDFARARAPLMSPCPLKPLIDEVIALVPARPNVTVRNRVRDDTSAPIIDRDQFRQVLANLVQNGIEAIARDVPGEVTVDVDGGGAAPWQIRVSDTGSGMSAEVIERIFEPLYSTKTKGSGLGLAVVLSIVHRHGGQLAVASDIGKGSTFTIELPSKRTTAGDEVSARGAA